MENEMANNTENSPLIPPVKQGRSLEYAAGIEGFRSEILKAGLTSPNEIIDDGRIHRFSSNGKTKDNAGWYVLFTDGIAAGAFGCWRENVKIKWCSVDEAELTQPEKHEFYKKIAEVKKQREHEEEINRTKARSKARSKASKIWEQSAEAPTDHSYLLSKKVQPHGLKLSRGKLVVPLYDQKSILHSLQFISYDGEKKFLVGGLTKGCYYPIGGAPDKILYVAEGFATAATVHEATGSAVAVAFNANNLKPVAIALRAKFPNLEIVICADDDHITDRNPGITKAREAALEVKASIAVPDFGETRGKDETDFNDLYQVKGLKAVRTCVELNRMTVDEFGKDTDLAVLAELAGNWEAEPEPVLPQKKTSQPFPLESFPLIIREAVTETLEYTLVPAGFACSTALGVAAASVQHLAMVARDSQTVGPVSLYILSILRSGERKSTIFRKMWQGVRDRQKELYEEWEHYEANDYNQVDPILGAESAPRILFEDATIQGLALEISNGVKSVLLSSSEGGTIFGGIGMRGDALMGAMACLNKAWDAEPQSMTRKQAVSTYLDDYRLSCLISAQRETLQEWLRRSEGLAEGMGFLARFLICVPKTTIGGRLYVPAPEFTPKLNTFIEMCLTHLRTKTDLATVPTLNLSSEAQKEWVDFFNIIEAAQGSEGDYEFHTATASKIAEQAARIAGVFTLFGNENPKEIDVKTMKMGIDVAKWFLEESLDWLKKLKQDDKEPLKLSDLLQIGPRCIRSKKERDAAVEILCNYGWIQIRNCKNRKVILLHPSIKKS
jgi:putative DNA primase/helicase